MRPARRRRFSGRLFGASRLAQLAVPPFRLVVVLDAVADAVVCLGARFEPQPCTSSFVKVAKKLSATALTRRRQPSSSVE